MERDLGLMCLCALRYTHGRKTYIHGCVIDYIKQSWNDLMEIDKFQILRDEKQAINYHETGFMSIGSTCDYQEHIAFIDWIVNNTEDFDPKVYDGESKEDLYKAALNLIAIICTDYEDKKNDDLKEIIDEICKIVQRSLK